MFPIGYNFNITFHYLYSILQRPYLFSMALYIWRVADSDFRKGRRKLYKNFDLEET